MIRFLCWMRFRRAKRRWSATAPLAQQEQPATTPEEKDPFEEIDFGSFFSEYLDPGMRTPIEMEDSEKPSFENFLSKPTNLTDHLMWQLGSLHVNEDVYRAAELVIGNLNEEGYLIASDDELLGLAQHQTINVRADAGAGAEEAVEDAGSYRWFFRRAVIDTAGDRSRGGPGRRCRADVGPISERRPRCRRVRRWCRHAPRLRGFRSAAMPCAKPLTWFSKWIPSGSAGAISANACWRSCTP